MSNHAASRAEKAIQIICELESDYHFGDFLKQRRPIIDINDGDWFYIMNTLQERGIIKYDIQNESGMSVYLTPDSKKTDERYYYVITDFNAKRLADIAHKNGQKQHDDKANQNRILTSSIFVNTTSFQFKELQKNNILHFEKNKYNGKRTKKYVKSKSGKKDAITSNPSQENREGLVYATVDFDKASITVTFNGIEYLFRKNLRDCLPLHILHVAAYKTGMGKRFTKDDLNSHDIKVGKRNLVEVFKKNIFGKNGVLAPFADIAPSAIQIMPEAYLTTEAAEAILKASDGHRPVGTTIWL